jgi:hypothetical protein
MLFLNASVLSGAPPVGKRNMGATYWIQGLKSSLTTMMDNEYVRQWWNWQGHERSVLRLIIRESHSEELWRVDRTAEVGTHLGLPEDGRKDVHGGLLQRLQA